LATPTAGANTLLAARVGSVLPGCQLKVEAGLPVVPPADGCEVDSAGAVGCGVGDPDAASPDAPPPPPQAARSKVRNAETRLRCGFEIAGMNDLSLRSDATRHGWFDRDKIILEVPVDTP
jgi:hypothetical protein